MSTLRRRFTRMGNRMGVWLYRTFDGRLSGGSRQVRVLMITTPGRHTGIPRSTCVRYLEVDEGYLVWGTASGSRQDPDWFRNLRQATVARIQVGPASRSARVRELHGDERDAVWRDVVLRRAPGVARYARRARRTIPVAVLRPAEEDVRPGGTM